MLDINLDLDRFDIPAVFKATNSQINLAYRRSMGKTLRWLQTRISRELADKFDLPMRVFQVRAKRSFDSESGALWIGLNPIAAKWLGKGRQTKTGVSVRSHRLNGAFLAKMPNEHIGIFQRGERTTRNGKVYYPLKTVMVMTDSGFSYDFSASLESYEKRASVYFKKTFEHELDYLLSKQKAA